MRQESNRKQALIDVVSFCREITLVMLLVWLEHSCIVILGSSGDMPIPLIGLFTGMVAMSCLHAMVWVIEDWLKN